MVNRQNDDGLDDASLFDGGNPALGSQQAQLTGSIPASAGEPHGWRR